MASEVPRMEQEVEDGEISGSDCEMPVSAPSRSPQQNDNGNPAISFPSSSSQSATSVPYRTVKNMDSTDESFSDSDEESGLWKRKRQKCSNLPPPKPELFQFSPNSHKQIPKKVNNIWGEVLQRQNQDDMAKNLGILWMDGNLDKSRGSETYNYMLAKQLMKQSESEVEKTLDKELDEYMQDDKKTVSKEEEEVNRQDIWKRKRPIKERVGQRQEMNYKGRYEITEDDPEEKVADEIAYRLHEPKKDLIVRVVKIIGKKKSIELLMETAEVEQNGGLLIMDGSRRRTPGGVYINLLKNTPCITSEQIKEIFYIENQKEYENKCAAKKRRFQVLGKKMKQAIKGLNLQEYDDASRETFASDTNEALASLDDLQEGHGEIKLDVEHVFEADEGASLIKLPTTECSISCSMSSSPKDEAPEGPKTNRISKGVNTDLRGFIHCHLPRFSCKHGMFPNLYVMPWKQDMKYRALHLQHADQVELYSGPREDTLFLEKSERHCHGEDRKKVMQKVPHEDIIVDIPIYSHLSKYHKSMVAYGFRAKL